MKKITFLILNFGINYLVNADCLQLNNYYTAMNKYINQCQSIGVMPAYYGEPNQSGTPRTTAKVLECIPLLQVVHLAANQLSSYMPTPGDYSSLSCPVDGSSKTAMVIQYRGLFGLNKQFGLLSPCEDPFMVVQTGSTPIPFFEFNSILYPNLCGF